MRKPKDVYLEKAGKLKEEDLERLLARARRKVMRWLEEQQMSPLEVAAIQMEIEDEELAEWRKRWAEIQEKAKSE
jgi:hypothetical protein